MSSKRRMAKNKVPPPPQLTPSSSVKKQKTTSTTEEPTPSTPTTNSGLDPEAEDKFELELCWCVQQLEAGLSDTKLNEKQIYNITKSMNVLKSSTASLIKKRQIMRNAFGDYRAKMAEDEKKFAKTSTLVKFGPVCLSGKSDNKAPEKKSVFLRKAAAASEGESKKSLCKLFGEKLTIGSPKEPFRFNFTHVES